VLHVTEDIVELRRWTEARRGWPCRDPAQGRLRLAFPGEPCSDIEVDWDEFEATFCAGRCVLVYDDGLGARHWFIGSEAEARAFVAQAGPGGARAWS
jgi:hypothetical protein